MQTIQATTWSARIPAWAVLQRKLFAESRTSAELYLAKYTRADGSLIWRDTWNNGRDGVDDFYEAYVNWPLLYLLGGDDWFLERAQAGWDAITRQLSAMGVVRDEYELGYDQFHQSEHYTLFYALCLADPANMRNAERAKRFADLYLSLPNYDPAHNIIRAPHNGSGGPRWGFYDDGAEHIWSYSPWMQSYGLPFDDIPGAQTLDDIKDPTIARRVGDVLHRRYGQGDSAANLGVCPLIANAYLVSGERKYADWLAAYIGGWMQRAEANGGLIPDNVGLSGKVGEDLDGKWYGGLYGWQWPHGYYNIGMASIVAAASALLSTGDSRYLQLPRQVMDTVFAMGKRITAAEVRQGSLGHHWINQLYHMRDNDEMFAVPFRHKSDGWFDYQPMSPVFPAAMWALTQAPEDWERIDRIRSAETYDWREVVAFHTKEDSGHEQPWIAYLTGDNPSYPTAAVEAALSSVARRAALIAQDTADLSAINIHHWQQHNPVTTEALVQLTLGAPQPIYNGGLLIAPVRYFDAERNRPGLPPAVAALVEHVDGASVRLRLVNTSTVAGRSLIIQAGTFGEHRFDAVAFDALLSEYPAQQSDYAPPPMQTERRTQPLNDVRLRVELPPAAEIALDLSMSRYVNHPTYA